MTKKTFAAYSAVGVAMLGLAVATPVIVSAHEAGSGPDGLAAHLAEKLGVSEDRVKTALEETREQHHQEREQAMKEKIAQAVKDGKLTQKQANILEAMHEIREEQRGEDKPERPDLSGLTEEQRQARREEFRTQRQQEMIADLKEAGITVTAEELEQLHETMQDLGFGGPRGGMRRGMRR